MAAEEIRAGLMEEGLREEVKALPGYAFTLYKEPHSAVSFYTETHGGMEPQKFYIAQRMYLLSN
jgi:hypothetical protein